MFFAIKVWPGFRSSAAPNNKLLLKAYYIEYKQNSPEQGNDWNEWRGKSSKNFAVMLDDDLYREKVCL